MRHSLTALIVLLCAGLFIASCGKKAPEKKDTESAATAGQTQNGVESIKEWGEPTIFRGFAKFGENARLFQPCGTTVDYWVLDLSGQFWDLHYDIVPHTDPLTQIFAAVLGTLGPPPTDPPGSAYAGTLRIEEILYMTHEGLDCKTYWNSFQFRASGNEPFWNAEVTERELRLTRMGEPDKTWTDITISQFENGFRYTAGGEDPVELVITSIPCRDTMSGAYYGYNATLKLGKVTLRGCAVPGRNPSPPPS